MDARKLMELPLHGGGQGFESPRLHSRNAVLCKQNARTVKASDLAPAPLDSDALEQGVFSITDAA